MAISRYKVSSIINNNDPDYKKIFSTRFGPKGLTQYVTNTFRKPTEEELLEIEYLEETWKLGQRLYKLSYTYYGDSQYWWIIALFNNIAIESDLKFGQVVKVPVPLNIMLNLYGL